MAIAEREFSASKHTGFHTAAEYLALEDLAEEKSEFIHGIIRPRPGGTVRHALVMAGLGFGFHQALRKRELLVSMCDLKVGVRDVIYYPEVCIFARPCNYYEGNKTVITNSLLAAEIIAPKTEVRDRGEKLHNYLSVHSLQVHLLVSQNEPRVEMYSRREDGGWVYRSTSGLNSVLVVPAFSISVALSEIYQQVKFEDEEDETDDE